VIEGVILIGVGRNLNRAIRTCYSFGVYDIYCLNCTAKIKGDLYSAAGKVRLHEIKSLDLFNLEHILGLEKTKSLPFLQRRLFEDIKYIAVGGESVTLRQKEFPRMARIATANNLCLTAEAALAIALYLGGGNYD